MTEQSWIERVSDIKPGQFLRWFLGKVADDVDMPDEVDDWFVLYFQEAGVDKHVDVHAVGLPADGYFDLWAGVQSVHRNVPEWANTFADRVGWKPKESHWLTVADILIQACQDESFEIGCQWRRMSACT